MYEVKQDTRLEEVKSNILRQNSDYLNKNHREVNIVDLVKKYRKNTDDITEYWVWLPPEFTSISQFISLINLRLI